VSVDDQLEYLAGQLEAVAESLVDLAIDQLRLVAEQPHPDPEALAVERRVTRARRSVEKAITLLSPRPALDD
jgi:hypothetical protein